jgi:hypothetical protein
MRQGILQVRARVNKVEARCWLTSGQSQRLTTEGTEQGKDEDTENFGCVS